MNFLCVSNYNNDLSWLDKYSNSSVIYDRSDNDSFTKGRFIFKSPNIGYNIYDILSFIIDSYDSIPWFTTFCKGNVFPRHVSQETFEKLKDNKKFTCIFDYTLHKEGNWNFFTSEGNYSEINNNWYMHDGKPYKYFSSYNDFISYFFVNPVLPKFITFCPGGNYVVPKDVILKYPIEFYKNLRTIISHSSHAAESHLVERALYTIWNCDFDLSKDATKLIT
jgi:hypothetical protein